MKTTPELMNAAYWNAHDAARALEYDGGNAPTPRDLTVNQLVSIETSLQISLCAVRKLVQRAKGIPEPKEGQ